MTARSPASAKVKAKTKVKAKPKPSRTKVSEHRARLRAQGLKPIQIWVPDVASPSFRKEAHRQALAVAKSAGEKDDQAFIESLFDLDDE